MYKILKNVILKNKILKNKILRYICIYAAYMILTAVLIPYFLTKKEVSPIFGENGDIIYDGGVLYAGGYEIEKNNKNNISIKEENPLMESYIIGVVAAEMPASFEKEALKAQAVAARTYAYRQVGNSAFKPEDIGQAYITADEMKERWGNSFESNYKKISEAVAETKNEIMTYDGEPILAAFHSTSGGVTESSENVWEQKLSYLTSVDSHEDEKAPGFLSETRFSKEDFIKKFSGRGAVFSDNIQNDISITKRTAADYVAEMEIGKKIFKGTQIREILSLRSSNFTVSFNGDEIIFTTKGYGHGAGMSQYGANFMAASGDDYKKILSHYYYGVEFISIKG